EGTPSGSSPLSICQGPKPTRSRRCGARSRSVDDRPSRLAVGQLFRGDEMEEEGWYVDPYGVHEARWISAGTPTALVRDSNVEARDPPPKTPYVGQLAELPETVPRVGNDLLRADDADDADKPFDPDREA